MKLVKIVLKNLFRHRLRTLLTMLGIATAVMAFGLIRTIVGAWNAGVEASAANRMITRHSVSFIFPVPLPYRQTIARVPNVAAVSWANWFGGQHGDGKVFFATFAVDAQSYLAMYPEVVVPPDQKEAFLRERTAALVGKGLMEQFGWKLGQNVTIKGTIFPGDWIFTIRGVYTPSVRAFDDRSFIFHYAYMDERLQHRISPGWYTLQLTDPALAPAVAQTIDDMFRNSTAATKTMTEKAFNQSFVTMWGNVQFLMNSIGLAVVFAILMVTANAMMMTARERTGEVAVLKTIGFTDRTLFLLVMLEAAVLTLTGAVLGLGGAKLLYSGTGFNGFGFLPGFDVKVSTLVIGFAIAIILAVASGLVPALRAARLSIVQALRHVE